MIAVKWNIYIFLKMYGFVSYKVFKPNYNITTYIIIMFLVILGGVPKVDF